MRYSNILEEEIKNKVSQDFFGKFDCTKILGKIDFAVKQKGEKSRDDLKSSRDYTNADGAYLLWAEAKQKPTDIYAMLTQLVLTIGKARTFDEIMPPPFLGCYDNEKIAFVPYSEIQYIFYQNDFNWKVTSSNTETKEFKQVYEQVKKIIDNDIPWQTYLFYFERDEKELKRFIRENFIVGKNETTKIQIDKNNFISVYNRWRETVMPTISVNWDAAKKANIIDGDFYLADLLSSENSSIKDNLFVLLHSNFYEIDRKINETGLFTSSRADFSDNQKAHNQFWARYERPPHEEYWDYIVNRRDLLVPQDVRERKGSFFTPQIWVELSQKYLADALGKDWQDEYYVWDCAAGTGNLLAGLTNKYNIWASTLDTQDVNVMRDRIKNGANLLADHVFQFDFLNDDFSKLPQGLQNIINDPKKRKKLVVYINPPYAEAGRAGTGTKGKKGVEQHKIHDAYKKELGRASHELFAQFLTRIYFEIQGCKIGEFSKLKGFVAPHFNDFRKFFLAKLKKCFIVPANTFDNVSGQFPIGFKIWDTSEKESFESASVDVYDAKGILIGNKTYQDGFECKYINDWYKQYTNKNEQIAIGRLSSVGNDFQQQALNYIGNVEQPKRMGGGKYNINEFNLIQTSIYYAVKVCIPATWLNDRDQFLYPNDDWQADKEFQNDCLAYTLFNNNIQSKYGVNHWIPFTEQEVNARDKFASNFMANFIANKKTNFGGNGGSEKQVNMYMIAENERIISEPEVEYIRKPLQFSKEAIAVFDAGRELWRYYHAQPKCNVNASLYDIREHFQGRSETGKMNNTSTDEKYTELISNLRNNLKILAQKIEPKVYEYEFLKK
ncbi:hypothetical protein FACS189467_4600 [Bacteroidia bacterium]|nr:hypothetical protein FACS189467_4600 [Bacteroidia bacterium]